MNFDKLKKLSFDEIDYLLDYLTDGEEKLEEVDLKKEKALVRTNKKVYLLETINDDSNYSKAYGVLWEQ